MAPYSPITLCHLCHEREATQAIFSADGRMLDWSEARFRRLFCESCVEDLPLSEEWTVQYVNPAFVEDKERESLQTLHDHLVESRGIGDEGAYNMVWLSATLWLIRTDHDNFDSLWSSIVDLDIAQMTAADFVTLVEYLRDRFADHWRGL